MGDFTLDVRLTPAALAAALAVDVREGLTSSPKWLPPKWFYDERGSVLFDQITRLPEYYPTRREKEILTAHAVHIADLTRAQTLVELGSGTSEKTRWLLDALRAAGTLRRFVPFDVDETMLTRAGEKIAAQYPGVDIHAVCGDFERHLHAIPHHGRTLVALLGGTIGNLQPAQRKSFFADIRAGLRDGDALLLGTDLVKDSARLIAAYDDSAGVTADFNRNMLRVLNRELGADAEVDAFANRARFDTGQEWIEMHLVATTPQVVTITALGLRVAFAAGESVRTEISAKFRRPQIEAELAAAGLRLGQWWTDDAGDYALSLAVPGAGCAFNATPGRAGRRPSRRR